MVYDYQYDIAGILFILMAIICVLIRPGAFRAIGRNLRILALIAMIYNILDIVTSAIINMRNENLYVLCYVLLILYFTVLFLFPFQAAHFFFEICGETFPLPIMVIPFLLIESSLLIGNRFFGTFFILRNHPFVYFTGMSNKMVYVLYGFYSVMCFICAIRHSRYLGLIRRRLLITILIVTACSIVYRIYCPQVMITGLVMGISVASVMIVFYFVDVTRDELTGLNNRKGFQRACSELLHGHEDLNNYHMIKLQVYDIQGLNERLGFATGNRMLKRLSDEIRVFARSSKHQSICSRIGGDKFGILTDADFTSNFPMTMGLSEFLNDDTVPADYIVSLYAGIYDLDKNDEDVDGMLDRAGFALKKVLGNFHRNIASYEGVIRSEDERRKAVEQRVRGALQRGEFKTYLQPVHNAQNKARVSAEALIRWIDSEGRVVQPGEFVPILEGNGFIRELDLFILDSVCRMQRECLDNGTPVVPISVNVSRVDLRAASAVDDIIETVDRYRLPHNLIKIELTESAFVDDNELITRSLSRLHDEGFPIMMDDFGSGYSNLNMFKDMPIDIVKIDMIFLRGIEGSKNGMIVVESVVDMAKRLGLQTVVEGVETQQQYEFIRELGCEMIQGYYFSRPIPAEQFFAGF